MEIKPKIFSCKVTGLEANTFEEIIRAYQEAIIEAKEIFQDYLHDPTNDSLFFKATEFLSKLK